MPFWNSLFGSSGGGGGPGPGAPGTTLTITFGTAQEYTDIALVTAAVDDPPAPLAPGYTNITGQVPGASIPGYTDFIFNIPSTTRIVSSSPGNTTTGSAIQTGTFLPTSNITVNNSGAVVGAGGNGGNGGSTNNSLSPVTPGTGPLEGDASVPFPAPPAPITPAVPMPSANSGANGQAGVPAIYYGPSAFSSLTINQNGSWGGGGGGGGGSGGTKIITYQIGGGGDDPESVDYRARGFFGGRGGAGGAGGSPKTGGGGQGGLVTAGNTQLPGIPNHPNNLWNGNPRLWPNTSPTDNDLTSPGDVSGGATGDHASPQFANGGAGGHLGQAGQAGVATPSLPIPGNFNGSAQPQPVEYRGNKNGGPGSGGSAGGRTNGPTSDFPKLTFNDNNPTRTYGSDLQI